ncbi:MAG: hypothetical protein IJK10_05605, partial [Firmicutes bacterium]|nr:hypothetical protein [Bacillota bacterium]
MSFLDNLKETTKNLGGKMAETASDLKEKASDKIEIEKLKMKISSAESDIKSVYTEMGKKLFQSTCRLRPRAYHKTPRRLGEEQLIVAQILKIFQR